MKKIIIFLIFLSIAYCAFAAQSLYEDSPMAKGDKHPDSGLDIHGVRQKNSKTSFIDTIKVLETGKKGKYEMTVMCIANDKYLFINGNSTIMIPTGNECE